MPRHARQLAESGVYHVMLRGVNRDAIFLEDEDYERFLTALSQTRDAAGCSVLAYCLMTNHVHLVVRTSREPIGPLMKRLGIRYASWFNRKYGRVGHLFQDRFKSLPVDDDTYLVAVIRYVWRNPVEAGLVVSAEHYRWSSRRLRGRVSDLVDEGELLRLMAPGSEIEAQSDPTSMLSGVAEPGAGTRTQAEVNALLVRVCGATEPGDFLDLPRSVRRRTIAELRTRSVSYAQIALATGMSASSVRRVHVVGDTRPVGARDQTLRLVPALADHPDDPAVDC